MNLQKAMVVLGIIFLVSLGLCGLSTFGSGMGLHDTLPWLSLMGMVLSFVLLIVVFIVWFVREIYRSYRGRND